MGTTTGRLGVTTYNAGDTAWSHTAGLETIDTNITNILKGKMFATAVTSSSSAVNLTSLDSKGVGLLEFTSASGGNDLTTITNGTDEQFLFVRFTNASPADVIHGTGTDAITLRRAANWTPSQNDWLILWYDSSVWREVSSSAPQVASGQLAAASVNTTALKSTTQTGSLGGGSSLDGSGGQYHLWPVISGSSTPTTAYGYSGGATGTIFNNSASSLTYTWRYIQSSPPWFIGGEEWGSFLYLVRNKSTGEVYSSSIAQDPSWYMGGASVFDKDDPRRIAQAPSPFNISQYPPDAEIVLVDLRSIDLEVNPFDVGLERAKVLRSEAAAAASVGGGLDAILALTAEAEALESSATPVRRPEFMLRDARAHLLGTTPWEMVKDLPQVVNASSQARSNGKPIKLGVRSADDLVTIVTAG